jgi:dsDNA-specific endonuclease/ATPase MutS2
MDDRDPIEVPIDGTLDLHTFDPREIGTLIPDYISACREAGILQVRIVHGKGTGTLRRTVHAILDRLPEVASYSLGGHGGGSWGATIARLKPLDTEMNDAPTESHN